MPVLLHLDSSAAGKESISRSVGNLVRADWQGDVIYRDLGADPVPPITAAHVIARHTDPAELSAELKDATALQDQLIDEFLAADAYLFTVPMYSYSVPAAFKAWIDQIVVLGRTLPLPGGTAPTAGRPVVVVSARGGGYSPGTLNHDKDFALPWLQLILADTLGLDLRFITPELTLAPTVPAMEQLVPLDEQSPRTGTGAHRGAHPGVVLSEPPHQTWARWPEPTQQKRRPDECTQRPIAARAHRLDTITAVRPGGGGSGLTD
jgi:FMN-dependent NADH-azoreductase